MNISAWSIRNPIPTIVLFLCLTLAGWLGFTQLEVDDTPNIDISIVNVTVTQQGAGPVELESQVTKAIEDAVASIDNVDTVSSTVNDGVSSTLINFDLGMFAMPLIKFARTCPVISTTPLSSDWNFLVLRW